MQVKWVYAFTPRVDVGVRRDGSVVRIGNISGFFNRGATLSRIALGMGGNRFIAVLKPSKYNGAALLHLVTNFRATSRNRVGVSKGRVARAPPRGHPMGAMFRGCTLFPRLGMCSGVTFKLGLGGVPGRAVRGGMGTTLGVIKVASCRCHSMSSLSNKRRRHITVTHTVIGRPRILLLSRPLTTLSLGVHGSVRVRLGRVRGSLKVAFICIARSRRRTLALDSAVMIVDRKHVRRVNAPVSVCGRPVGSFMTSFVKRDGVLGKIVVRSGLMHFYGARFRYMSRNFNRGVPISMIVHPRSLCVFPISRTTRLANIIRSSIFGNMRCRVAILYGNCRFLMRSCRRFRIKTLIKLLIGPFSVRVVGGRHIYGAFRNGLVSRARIRFLKYGFRYTPIAKVRTNDRIGIRINFSGIVLRSGRRSNTLAKRIGFVLCGNSRCRLAILSS